MDIKKKKNKYRIKHSMFESSKTNCLVYFDCPFEDEENHNYPFKNGEILIYLGEIQNNKGHAIVANEEGKVIWGYHTENFVEITDEIEDYIVNDNGIQKVIWK